MTYSQPFPKPNNADHTAEQTRRRNQATAASRPAQETFVNEEANDFAPVWPTNFHKGLHHDIYGAPEPKQFTDFFEAINDPDYVNQPDPIGLRSDFDVPVGPIKSTFYTRPLPEQGKKAEDWKLRAWESPLAGHQYDLQGPSASAVSMAPFPRLGSDELAAEMAEVYGLAILRDVAFADWDKNPTADSIAKALGTMPWFDDAAAPQDADGNPIDPVSRSRRNGKTSPSTQTMFRGSSKGCLTGPYISQFMLQGSGTFGKPAKHGEITFGAQRISQKVYTQKAEVDYLTDWGEWLDVQNGAKTNDQQAFEGKDRFVATPRDLATYVHFDALYQAYLNACLLMLSWKVPAERGGFPEPNELADKRQTRDGFATFGGPHVLTLVTETATRSLKAVRRQKYNFHLRARPEMLGAVTHLCENGYGDQLGPAGKAAATHFAQLDAVQSDGFHLLNEVAETSARTGYKDFEKTKNYDALPKFKGRNLLLPMAFSEGSPMHPAYGAGHATVAGSCVTVLKAFFEMFTPSKPDTFSWTEVKMTDVVPEGQIYEAAANGSALNPYAGDTTKMTLQGELNKLAANISIGRNMAGVHFYSDYFDSLRMGERIAVGMLYEQLGTYTEAVTMRFHSFDGDRIVLSGNGQGGAELSVGGSTNPHEIEAWWERHQGQPRNFAA